MELRILLFVSICFLTPIKISATSVPKNSSYSAAEILVNLLVAPRVTNATEQMKLLYPFITSSGYLREPPISLGLDLNPDCSNKKTANEKLKTLYSQMAVFKKPAYFAFSLEDGRGALHNSLANVLEMTSYSVNDTVSYVTRQMALKSLSVPALPKIPEAKLDERTRLYLSALVQSNSVTLTITDDIVKTYRNYVIMYVLYDVIKDLGPCM
ncbi:uncharacterized protein [Porites lutea]|uniref:uncharacterized protein n=1 Tax=Porites lutea TaxID=51062 RepID=UPI003CC6A60A